MGTQPIYKAFPFTKPDLRDVGFYGLQALTSLHPHPSTWPTTLGLLDHYNPPA